jgi:hypothetical protein
MTVGCVCFQLSRLNGLYWPLVVRIPVCDRNMNSLLASYSHKYTNEPFGSKQTRYAPATSVFSVFSLYSQLCTLNQGLLRDGFGRELDKVVADGERR